jgi:hypothetical protein
MFSGVNLTLPKYKIVDCGAFYEVTFFLHLAQKSVWGLFLQAQRIKSAASETSRLDCLVYARHGRELMG